MVRKGAQLTLKADADNDNSTETGVFDLSRGITISPQIRTGKLIGERGGVFASALNFATGAGDEGRGGFTLDAGAGAHVVVISFNSFEGSTGRWGDGSASDETDAEGEGVWRQISVLQRYLDVGTFDSQNPATLEYGEFSSSGVYSPLEVSPEEPGLTFDATEQTSVFAGDLTFVSTRAISEYVSQNTK